MNEGLTNSLCQRYPRIFALRPNSTDVANLWGIMCGDGWFGVLDALCESLQFATDRNGAPQVVAVQVKEKFGTLSFYCHDASDAQRGMIAMAAGMSARLCEQCGKPGQVLVHNSIHLARCAEHAPRECAS